ncbi:hypothetical protein AGDE_13692 [Angomonas deanei]|nr:hypothetical protein AGDE_13692 [Angomonas deanei]|eukprot:EPY21867.1 hypothetical protein AGDE_13692 [Angomonas deanei]
MLYSKDPAAQEKYANIADTIIECRMLCNFGRPSLTLRQGILCFRERKIREFYNWFFSCLSIFLRIFEQLSGDCNYLQKVLFNNWSRELFSFYYRFFKSFSLTSSLIADCFRRVQLVKNVQKKKSFHHEHDCYELHKVNLIIFRTLCDIYVYYKWIPWYKPYRTMEYIAGSVSGMLGVYLVWADVVRAHRIEIKVEEEEDEKELTPLTSPVRV